MPSFFFSLSISSLKLFGRCIDPDSATHVKWKEKLQLDVVCIGNESVNANSWDFQSCES